MTDVKARILIDTTETERNLDGLNSSLKEVQGNLEGVNNEAKQSDSDFQKSGRASDKFAGALSMVGGAATAAAAAIVAAGAAAITWANEVERTNGILNRTQGSVRQAQQAVGGMVAQLDLVISRNRLMQSGIELSNEDFANLAEVATDFAAATGEDASQAIEQLGDALMGLSADELEKFGIQIDSSRSRGQQFAAALDQLQERAHGMETGADTAAGAVQRFSVALSDARTEAAFATNVFLRQLEPAASHLSETIGRATENLTGYKSAMELVGDLGISLMAAITASIQTTMEAIDVAIQGWTQLFSVISQIVTQLRQGRFDLSDISVTLPPDFDPLARFTENLDSALAAYVQESGTRREQERQSNPETRLMRRQDSPDSNQITPAEYRETQIANIRQFFNELENQTSARQRSITQLHEFQIQLGEIQRERERQWEHERLEASQEAREAALEAVDEARLNFSEASGIDELVDSFHRLNEALAASGQQTVSTTELMSRHLEQLGNSVLENVGGKFAEGFATALTAVIKGEEDFGKAMEKMLQSLMETLFAESLVQTLVQTAQGIGAAASYQFDKAALHFTSAAVWGAVAVATGIGTAAMAGANKGAASTPNAGATQSGNSGNASQGGGNVTYNVNYNNPFYASHPDVQRGLERELSGARI